MKTRKLQEIIIKDEDKRGLEREGYMLMSYDGDFSLAHKSRTNKNSNDGELSLKGARSYAHDVLRNLKGVKEVLITKCGNWYDVYAKTMWSER